MRLPKIENYSNNNLIEVKKISDITKAKRSIVLITEKDKIKFIKMVESVVRTSQEYKDYINFLREVIDMTSCSFFKNVSNKDTKKISIEIHHEPFTLFDISQIVIEKWISDNKPLNPILISEEIVKLHYQNKVGLIPLSVTVHELVHDGKLFIPLQSVKGEYIKFLEEYEPFVSDDIKNILESKYILSRELQELDLSILEKKYVYIEVDGMTFPQILEEVKK